MAASKYIDWLTCAEDDCIGVRLPTGGKCWAHADEQALDAALKRLGEDGHLDARGVPITQELLERVLATAPQDDHGRTLLQKLALSGDSAEAMQPNELQEHRPSVSPGRGESL
jgi:hypothetical protein